MTTQQTLERHELKYVIPYALVERISQYVSPYCELDEHSATSSNGFYQVNSLYFDTPGSQFLTSRLWGSDSRFNMRARAYSDDPGASVFLEVKHRRATISKKYRAEVPLAHWPTVITDSAQYPVHNDANLALFQRLATSYAIEPKVFTQYRRRAFFSTIDAYTRITMDRAMKYRRQLPSVCDDAYSLRPRGGLINYDNATIYTDQAVSAENVVLEIKCSVGFVPVWVVSLIQRFQLKQVGFSKYMNSALVSAYDDGERYMSNAVVGVH